MFYYNPNVIRSFLANMIIVSICIIGLGWIYNDMKTNKQVREAKKEYQSVEVVNKISDTSSVLWLQNTNYILVVKASDGSLVSARVDAPAYAVIESGDTIHMAFYQADSASAYEPFASITKLTDLDITSKD